MKKLVLKSVLALLVVIATATTAGATVLTLTLYDGVNPAFSCADGAGCDANAVAGAVTYLGGLGLWTVNVTTGVGNPLLGTAAYPHIDLNSINVNSAAPANLLITLVQSGNGPSPSPLGLGLQIGGTTAGTVYAGACSGPVINPLAPCGDVLLGPFSSGAFAGTGSFVTAGGLGPYDVAIQTFIHHAGVGATSFDAELQTVPEPATYALMGLGLVAAGFLRRRRA